MTLGVQHTENQTVSQLITLAYDELQLIAALQMRGNLDSCDMQPKDVVHEAYLRLSEQTRAQYRDYSHFVRIARIVIRRVLADYHRHRSALKRAADRKMFDLEVFEPLISARSSEDTLLVDEVLGHLRRFDRKQAEIVELRYFDGLSIKEIARRLGMSPRTVRRQWSMARSWLLTKLSDRYHPGDSRIAGKDPTQPCGHGNIEKPLAKYSR